ncbi:HNH endonuclease signature motif containing protein [Microtetraspora glauca]|uniref:HNH endonuclease signature motif containing protein n=1 Tax=Microtetraspora glauca TaxID=1996 RepID=A0ABV3GRX5_MICGL
MSLAGRVVGSRDGSADLKNRSADLKNDTAAGAAGAAWSVGFAAGELRVQVSTLMHLDDLPAELAGWGPIHAHLARRLAKRQIGGEWRFAICDEQGQLLHAGITRRRPAGWPRHPAPGPAHGRGLGLGLTPGLPSQPCGDGSDPAGTARVGMTPARTPAAGQEDGDRPGGALRARPTSVRRRGIVELQLPLSLLRELYADIYAQGGWAAVIADIMRQYGQATGQDSPPITRSVHGDGNSDGSGSVHGDGDDDGGGSDSGGGSTSLVTPAAEGGSTSGLGTARSADARSADPGARGATARDVTAHGATAHAARDTVTGGEKAAGDERRRFPTAGLRRRIEIRDRVCSHPGCRAPAARSEMDHTRQYAHGGPTTEHNLAAACAHDHDLRDNGWQVVQTSPGHVTWISRTGHRYPAEPPPIIEPMPEPFAPNGWTGPNERGAANTHPASGPKACGCEVRATANGAQTCGSEAGGSETRAPKASASTASRPKPGSFTAGGVEPGSFTASEPETGEPETRGPEADVPTAGRSQAGASTTDGSGAEERVVGTPDLSTAGHDGDDGDSEGGRQVGREVASGGGGHVGREIGGGGGSGSGGHVGSEVGGGGRREIVGGFGGESGAHGLAVSGYGAGSITDPANDELPFLPTWTYEPAWWEEPTPEPPSAERGPVTPSGLRPDPANDIPPF